MEGQHDVLAGDAGSDKLLGDGARGAVVLHPDLAAADVDVDDRAVHAADAVPADVHHLVMVARRVHHGLRHDLAVRGLVAGVLLDEGTNDLTVAGQLIHWTTFSCRSSNTNSRTRSRLTTSWPSGSARIPAWTRRGTAR